MPPLSSPCQCQANLDPCALRKSDPAYRIRARMATVLGTHGSVLIIEPTKMPAQRTPAARAEELDEDDPACAALVALATTRLRTRIPSLVCCVAVSASITRRCRVISRLSWRTAFAGPAPLPRGYDNSRRRHQLSRAQRVYR